jgi:hypothetical protein
MSVSSLSRVKKPARIKDARRCRRTRTEVRLGVNA